MPRQFQFAHLLFQFVIERRHVTIDHFLVFGIVLFVACPYLRHIVIVGYTIECHVYLIPAILIVVVTTSFPRGILIIVVHLLKGWIVVYLSIDILLHFGNRHLQHPDYHQLLLPQSLLLYELLLLCLDKFLRHSYL